MVYKDELEVTSCTTVGTCTSLWLCPSEGWRASGGHAVRLVVKHCRTWQVCHKVSFAHIIA